MDNPWLASAREHVARVVTVPATDPEAPGPFRYANVVRLLGLLDEAHRSSTDAYAGQVHDGAVRMDACVLLVTGGP